MAKYPVSLRKISDLSNDPNNARTHSAEQIDQIAASILEFGFTNPVAADSAGIVRAGNGRLEAARLIYERGEAIKAPDGSAIPKGQIPAIDCSSWSEAQCRAYALADNKIALNAGWDQAVLDIEIAALSALDFDIGLTGFGDDEVAESMARIAALTDQAGAGGAPDPDPAGGGPEAQGGAGSLSREFMIPPFSVLNAREGWWQDRKRQWLGLGIKSEVGRGDNLIKRSLHDMLCLVVPGPYQAASDYIAKHRADGLTDDQILALAEDEFGKARQVVPVVAGNGWGNGGPARRDPAFYAKKRAWEEENGREIDTTEFREKYWDGGDRSGQNLAAANRDNDRQRAYMRIDAYMKKTGASKDEASELARSDPRALLEAIGEPALRAPGSIPGGLVYGAMNMADGADRTITGTSIFDPVLCEIAYRWFSPRGGLILDPFSGGSVRGIVAAALGRRYIGIDLREEQIEANKAQWGDIVPRLPDIEGGDHPAPDWRCGDSQIAVPAFIEESGGEATADFVFSCPPYGDLEIYSDQEGDISNLSADEFDRAYAEIIGKAVAALKPNRFACFVIGDYRDGKGLYRNLPGKTIAAFEAAGASLYNEAILVTATSSLAIRAGKSFRTTRKLGKTHQNVLVFVKGDPRVATEEIGPVDISAALDPDSALDEADTNQSGTEIKSTANQYGEKLTGLGGEV